MSPVEPDLAKALDAMMRADLEAWSTLWFWALVVSTAVVVLGLIGELVEFWEKAEHWWACGQRFLEIRIRKFDFHGWDRLCPELTSVPPSRERHWVKVASFAAWLFVVVGVAGEGIAEYFVNEAETEVRAFDKAALVETQRSANSAAFAASLANTFADKAGTSASNAVILAKGARLEAGSAHQESSIASKELTQIEAGAKKTEGDLIDLALCNAPRVVTRWFLGSQSYADPLRPFAGQNVFIEVVPDAEARRAAFSIAQALIDAQWSVETPRFVDGLADGVSVQPYSPAFAKGGTIPNMSLYWHVSDVAEKLLQFLHSYNWQAERGWPFDPQGKLVSDEKILPAGAIRIQVGLYPAAVYMKPPGEKELTSRLEEINREHEKVTAELKRRIEGQLATLPPELRQKIEQDDKEMEAKSRVRNGPCQVLNPLFR